MLCRPTNAGRGASANTTAAQGYTYQPHGATSSPSTAPATLVPPSAGSTAQQFSTLPPLNYHDAVARRPPATVQPQLGGVTGATSAMSLHPTQSSAAPVAGPSGTHTLRSLYGQSQAQAGTTGSHPGHGGTSSIPAGNTIGNQDINLDSLLDKSKVSKVTCVDYD